MNRWLDDIARDATPAGAAKVARNKPPELVDACWTRNGEKIVDPTRCDQLYPVHGDPRIAAGAPLAGDILKCALKPIDKTPCAAVGAMSRVGPPAELRPGRFL